jgi:hypothetical protein
LVNTAGLYADLPAALQQKLEQRPFAVREYRVADVAARYRLSPDEIEEFCASVGIQTKTRDGQPSIVIYKPSIIEHPTTHERALVVHISGEFNRAGLEPAATAAFASDYAGPGWMLHRFHWRFPSVVWNARLGIELIVKPRAAWPYLFFKIGRFFRKARRGAAARPASGPRVCDLFTPDEIRSLGQSMRRRYSSFTWKRGDVLIVDNLKVAHAGMPGFGPRNLKALICNCVTVPYAGESSGLHAPRVDDIREPLGSQLVRFRETMAAVAVV